MKTGKFIYWFTTILVAVIFAASGLFKLFGGERTIEMAKGVGGQTNYFIHGIVELIIVVLWVNKKTGIIGTLLAVAYIGGAMSAHLVENQSILIPTIIQVFIWITAVIRFPELTQRLKS